MSLLETEFHVMGVLAREPMHGYAIMRSVESVIGGNVTTSTLYAAIDRLVIEGHLEPAGQEVADGRLRKIYRITEQGKKALRREVAQKAEVVRRFRANLKANPSGTAR